MHAMTVRKDHLDVTATTLLLACCLFWGFQQVLVKATLAEVPPVFQAAVRFAGATLLLWIWCRMRGVALFTRDGSLGRACWPALCSPGSSPASTWGCSTPPLPA